MTANPATRRRPTRNYQGKTADQRLAERRTRLLDAANTELTAGRWGDLTVDKLRRLAGVSSTAVYEQFPDLGALLQAVLAERGVHPRLTAMVQRALAGGEAAAHPYAQLRPHSDADYLLFRDDQFAAWYFAEVTTLRNEVAADIDVIAAEVFDLTANGGDGGPLDYNHAIRTAIQATVARFGHLTPGGQQ